MIAYLSVSTFRTRLDNLLKVKRGVYAGVTQELCNAFSGVNIEQVRQNRDMILMDDDQVVIKLRLPDKKTEIIEIRWLPINLYCDETGSCGSLS